MRSGIEGTEVGFSWSLRDGTGKHGVPSVRTSYMVEPRGIVLDFDPSTPQCTALTTSYPIASTKI